MKLESNFNFEHKKSFSEDKTGSKKLYQGVGRAYTDTIVCGTGIIVY